MSSTTTSVRAVVARTTLILAAALSAAGGGLFAAADAATGPASAVAVNHAAGLRSVTCIVNTDGATVHTGPGPAFPALARLPRGQGVQIIGGMWGTDGRWWASVDVWGGARQVWIPRDHLTCPPDPGARPDRSA